MIEIHDCLTSFSFHFSDSFHCMVRLRIFGNAIPYVLGVAVERSFHAGQERLGHFVANEFSRTVDCAIIFGSVVHEEAIDFTDFNVV